MSAADLHQHAHGSLIAQKDVDGLRNERCTPDMAYLHLVELATTWGWKSAAVRGYLVELAKRVR